MFCRSLFVLLFLFLWPLYCLSFFDLRLLINLFISQNTSCPHIQENSVQTKRPGANGDSSKTTQGQAGFGEKRPGFSQGLRPYFFVSFFLFNKETKRRLRMEKNECITLTPLIIIMIIIS